MFQEHAAYDELGFPVSIESLAYVPREYETVCAIFGRRSGKTDTFSSTVLAYEALLGGHEGYVREGAQKAICFQVAQDIRLARQNLHLIKATIESSPLLKKEIANITADWIELKNGVTIAVAAPNVKTMRGYAIPVVAMDEAAMWYSDAESANPDYEIERAVKYAQGQFPFRKRVITSTPWTKEGLLWKYHQAGTLGCKLPEQLRGEFADALVLHAPTAAVQNPLITKAWLASERARDPEGFERECLARFVDSISGFLSSELLRSAVDRSTHERAPVDGNFYVAAMDPAFKRDAFAFTIMHADPKTGIVQDVVRREKAQPGETLNPSLILDSFVPLLERYHISVVYSDQYHLETLQQLAIQRGFAIEGVPFTSRSKASILGNLQQLINQKRLRLLDCPEQIDELVALERKLSAMGTVQIAAPAGRHDDLATVVALGAFKAVWLLPAVKKAPPKEPTVFERCMAQIKRKRMEEARGLRD